MTRSFIIIFCIISIFLFAETDLENENLKGNVSTFFSYKYQPDPEFRRIKLDIELLTLW